MGLVQYPKEIYGIAIVSYLIFPCHFSYITFEKKTLACGSQVGHMWVRTSGLLCGSVGQVDQQAGMTHFQPWFASVNFITLIACIATITAIINNHAAMCYSFTQSHL